MEAAGTMSEGMMNFIYRSSSVVHTSRRFDAHVTVYFHPEIVSQ